MESLTTSLIAWTQFESGLNEFNEALGKDTGALKRLTGELEMGTNDDTITNNLAHDVKEVAKRLSENQNAIALASAQQVILFHYYCLPFAVQMVHSLALLQKNATASMGGRREEIEKRSKIDGERGG